MKTLLIDNYDSFTFNLFQDLSRVNSCEPIVIKNDELTWEEISQLEFDNVVISPGPGRPDQRQDFGICLDVVRSALVPVLGVCLGHQGLATAFGGKVAQADEPVHGRTSTIVHRGHKLFRGIPSQFLAVRYHSLIVAAELPPDLEAIAWTSGDLIMGLAHTSRPLYGVQFHPESILSEHGRTLLENFRDLTRDHHCGRAAIAKPCPKPAPSVQGRGAEPLQTVPSWRVQSRCIEAVVDSEELFENLYGQSESAFWLDSSSVRAGLSRFSFMGDASGPLSEVLSYDLSEQKLQIVTSGGTLAHKTKLFDYLKSEMAQRRLNAPPELPFDFVGGYVGYFAYELHRESLPGRVQTPQACAGPPDGSWLFVDRLLAIDHLENKIYLVELRNETPEDPENSSADWELRVQQTLAKLVRTPVMPQYSVTEYGPALPVELHHPPRAAFRQMKDCLDFIRRGESYELCLTNQLTARSAADPWQTYKILRSLNPAPYGAYLKFGGLEVLSSSPERFLKISASGAMEAKPIKGTAPRGVTEKQDEELRNLLAQSEKDRSENLMIVDLLRNDLGCVAETGSVQVSKLMEIESFATVHQMVSTVQAQLKQGLCAVDAIRACFPGGSMTGAPKKRSIEILEHLEEIPRGIYSGALGFLSLTGAADLSIVIRTLVAQAGKYTLGSGGAIVALSDPVAEFEELLLKAQAPLRALAMASSGQEKFTLRSSEEHAEKFDIETQRLEQKARTHEPIPSRQSQDRESNSHTHHQIGNF